LTRECIETCIGMNPLTPVEMLWNYEACGGNQGQLSGTFNEVKAQYDTWMGDRQGRLGAVNLGPFVGVDLSLWPTVYIALRLSCWHGPKMNQTKPDPEMIACSFSICIYQIVITVVIFSGIYLFYLPYFAVSPFTYFAVYHPHSIHANLL